MYLLSVAGLIACKDASLFEAFSCPWTPSSPQGLQGDKYRSQTLPARATGSFLLRSTNCEKLSEQGRLCPVCLYKHHCS